VKLRNLGLEYDTIDPFVTVSIEGVSKDSSLLLADLHPEWNQELKLTIRLPSTNMVESQYWATKTRVYFHVYDYNVLHGRGFSDYIGSASLPLGAVLASVGTSLYVDKLESHAFAGSPAVHMLTLTASHIQHVVDEKDMKLEVSVQSSADGVLENALHPTDCLSADVRC